MENEIRSGITDRAIEVHELLVREYPEIVTLLNYRNSFELLISVILSAQTTDRQVNAVTPILFSRYPDAESLSRADEQDVQEIIHSVGFFRSKTSKIIGTAAMLLADFNGKVPDTIDELIRLPGVGRKSANVVIGHCFGKPAVIVDTHFMRVTGRLGFTQSKDPDVIERELLEILPPEICMGFSMRINYHGRYRCFARKPDCEHCIVREHCRFIRQ